MSKTLQKRDENLTYDKMKETLKVELEDYFRPEFLNRLDEIIVFHKLVHDDMIHIVDLELAKLAKRVAEKDMELEVQEDAKDFLIEHGTDEKFGARPLRRAIEQFVEDALSEAMLRGDFVGHNKVVVTVNPDSEDVQSGLLLKGVTVETEEPEPVGAGNAEET